MDELDGLLVGARLRCLVGVAAGGALFVVAVLGERFTMRLGMLSMHAMAVAALPGVLGLYLVCSAIARALVLGRLARRPEQVALVELATRWHRLALRVTFARGSTATFSTGRRDRNRLIDAIRARAIARTLPAARVIEPR